MILIVTNKEDIHPTPVIEHFENMGVPFFRLNTESLLSDYDFEWISDSVNGDDFRIRNIHTGLEVYGHDIHSVWERRPLIPSELRIPNIDEVNAHNLKEAHGFLSFLLYYLGDRFCLGHHLYDRSSASKMLQLKVARNLGMKIPDTCFSNNKGAIQAFVQKYDRVCLKSIDNDNVWFEDNLKEHVFYTIAVRSEEILALGEEAFAQTVSYLQNYIEKDFELRVTVIEDNIFACKIDSQKMNVESGLIDWRQGLDYGMIHSEYEVPQSVATFCISFLNKLHLNFGCFDFIVTPEEEYVFLECNPNGQWLWIEQETGMQVSKCIAETLIRHDVKIYGDDESALADIKTFKPNNILGF